MLAEERFGQILDLLNKQRTATVQELCEALGTSESTIRRDLTELDRLGKLNKVHGGATLPDNRFQAEEPSMQAKEALAVPQKRAIAAAAAALIHAEDFVFIDAGSTTLELVRVLEGKNLQISDFRHVIEISDLQVIKELVAADCGITFLYRKAVERELSEGTLRRVPLADFNISHEFTFLWRKNSVFEPEFRTLFRELSETPESK